MKPLNTIPIDNFLSKARVAIKSNQKTLILPINEVKDLQNSINELLEKLKDAPKPTQNKPENKNISLDGGKF